MIFDAVKTSGLARRAPLDIADLGCGTGLCGPLFAPWAKTLVGVDLSARMINQARSRGVYHELLVEEISAFLAERPNQFDLAISADVFEYFGDLAGVLSAVAHALRGGGMLAFTLEKSDRGEGYALQPTRRYTHSAEYIRSLLPAAKLREVSLSEGALRMQSTQTVTGLVIVLQKPEVISA
jgi:predicted TPR repeat methyltransferase